MELRQLQYFVAVAEEGGFGRAAERLVIVQSAVSAQIGRLERELGVPLFDRSTRGTRLSTAGERLLPQARAALAAADRIRDSAAALRDGTDGVLRLGVVQTPDGRLDAALARLAARAPGLRVRLRQAPPAERLDALRSGRLDAALFRPAPDTPGLVRLPVWRDPLHVALPADHPLAAEPSPDLARLARLPLRLAPRDRNPGFHALVTEACRAVAADPPPGEPFTTLRETLAEIGTAPEPSWTVFYEVNGLPGLPRTAVRPLAALTVPTVLAHPAGPRSPALGHLLAALREPGPAPRTPI
ncbi:LysR family transcriptional regulator [Kitasatospora sp. NPDC002551]|uniref:LysR family transcriptional regulator n=1 Tax=Kitasatospora sp. NPDC002551 TaxID=3154539 RepID=UPI0033245A97